MKLSVSLSEEDVRVLDTVSLGRPDCRRAQRLFSERFACSLSRPRRGLWQHLGRVVDSRRGRHVWEEATDDGFGDTARSIWQVDFNPARDSQASKAARPSSSAMIAPTPPLTRLGRGVVTVVPVTSNIATYHSRCSCPLPQPVSRSTPRRRPSRSDPLQPSGCAAGCRPSLSG